MNKIPSQLHHAHIHQYMRQVFISILFTSVFIRVNAQQLTKQQYAEDFDYFWNTVKTDYCYWDKKQTDWNKVKQIYRPAVDTITAKSSFVALLENMLYELYDAHASLGTNTMESQRLVPSGADIWAGYINGKPIITEVRLGFGAAKAGIKPGMEIVAVNDVPVNEAVKPFTGKSLRKTDKAVQDHALRVLLAGKHSQKRKLTLKIKNQLKDFFPDEPTNFLEHYEYNGSMETKMLAGNIGYIRINNRLWDNGLIPLFDSLLNKLMKTKALILDMRETPGGGNTTVARAIMGRFITKEGFFQKHELTAEEREFGIKRSWNEIVSPRGNIYTKPLVILCNHWTGSVGEGIVIGFDALKRATVIGTKMAGLNGAIYSYRMPNSNIGFNIPVEKLFHVNGTARENFSPKNEIDLLKENNTEDAILLKAIEKLK